MTSVRQAAVPRTPAADLALIAAVMIAGVVAAQLAMPALWIVTPIVVTGLAVATAHSARRRLRPEATPLAPLPPRLERSVGDALAIVPPGAARDLLGDIVRRARVLLGTFGGQMDGPRLTRDVGDLVEACCDIAREHARLDAVLPAVWEPALAPAAARGAADDVSRDELRRRGDASRELLTQRLRDAAAMLEEMAVEQGVERGGSAAQRVAELTSELAAEAAARRHAAQEIQRLLEGR
jgi:hypothetical protein